MEEHPKRSRSLVIPLHILHFCFSFGLIVAVVHNQLVNNARFEKLESKCVCEETPLTDTVAAFGKNKTNVRMEFTTGISQTKTHSVGKRSLGTDITSYTTNLTETNRSETIGVAVSLTETNQHKDADINGTTINGSSSSNKVEFNSNNTTHPTPNISNASDIEDVSTNLSTATNTSRAVLSKPNSSYVNASESQILNSPHKTLAVNTSLFIETNQTKKLPGSANNTGDFSRMTRSANAKNSDCSSIVKIIEENIDMVSCFEKLKVIINNYLESRKPIGDCKLFQGTKGERGEKGCSGTFFAEPIFKPNPQRLVFNERNVAALTCTAVANPSAQITWYRDNTLINEQRDSTSFTIENRDVTPRATERAKYCPSEIPHPVVQSTLKIKKSNGSDTGTYTCMARNIIGTTSFNIDILVQVYVQLTTIPSNITVVQGEEVLLSCSASGVPRPTITWYRKDDKPMPAQHSVAMGDLRIRNISKEEEGTFVCLAENVLGSKTTEATVTVNVFPKITSFADHVITVNESTTLVLPCNATGYPVPELRWTKRNDSLPVGRYYFDSQVLNVKNVTYEDGGEYICTADNTVGLVNRSVQVLVQVAPKPLLKPKGTEFGYRGHDTILNFSVFANPPATIKWMKYGKLLQTLTQSNSSLTLTNVQYKDSGRYQVVARNILGEVRETTFLIVRDPVPASFKSTIYEKKTSVTCFEGFERMCSALGNPVPSIVWKQNGIILTESGNSSSLKLAIPAVALSQSGRYTCEATNRFGTARQHFDLDVLCSISVQTRCSYSRINSHSGRITSPNYPGNYNDNHQCLWKLTSSSKAKIVLLFESFKTERNNDIVKVYNGGSTFSPSLGAFSGSSSPPQINSTSNQLYITFKTDGTVTGSGFSIKYQVAGP